LALFLTLGSQSIQMDHQKLDLFTAPWQIEYNALFLPLLGIIRCFIVSLVFTAASIYNR
jgi:hypothetical protein